VIRKHNRRAAKAAFAISFGVAIVLGGFAGNALPATHGATHGAAKAAPTITIGTKNFPEEYILGQLYKQALEAKGFTVKYKENIGSTEIVQTALTSGKIDMYPEYTGVIVQVVFHNTTSPKSAAATYALAKRLEGNKGYAVLNPTPFYDTDVLAVTNATAKKYGLKTISDLKKVGAFKLGGFPECQTRNTCFVGYTKTYGLSKATFASVGSVSPYAALDSGSVLAADVFSTDPPLAAPSKYTVLTDPKHITGFQNVAPIVKASVAKAAGPNFTKTVNAVSAKLTLPAMLAMNKAVVVDKKSAESVAAQFLKANGLT
jgi:osmoprotectant transport system substrate-binding protein